VLFGTGSFLLGRSPVELGREFKALPIKPAVMEKWLHGNAAHVLKLPPSS
jgi:predicted TIM-barrel fold metal-dependent hydrolase